MNKKTNWYKLAQYTSDNTQGIDTPLIMVQPYEPLVQEAVDELQSESPNIFIGVNKINLDMGYGQFGSVSSDNPADINININNIKSEVSNQLGSPFDPNNEQHKKVMKDSIKRVIVHEKAHVSDYDQDSHLSGGNPFPGGEGVAEQAERNYIISLMGPK